MAASRFIEEESGTYTSRYRHPHNGYYAGDFSQMPVTVPDWRLTLPGHRDGCRDVLRAWQ